MTVQLTCRIATSASARRAFATMMSNATSAPSPTARAAFARSIVRP